jgi:N-acetylmuramoyl-L-alanine amidase
MALHYRILGWIVSRDWRGLLGRVWRLAWKTAGIAARITASAARAFVRHALTLADWALRWPRLALGTGLALVLALGTFAVLWPAARPHIDLSLSLDCLALNIYHEARGEPLDGQVAVAQVVMNRVGDPAFPGQVCAVVRQGGEGPQDSCQFSWWCDGRDDRPGDLAAWTGSKDLARRILAGSVDDPTGGALWYHANYVDPDWNWDIIQQAKIGRHVFYGRR